MIHLFQQGFPHLQKGLKPVLMRLLELFHFSTGVTNIVGFLKADSKTNNIEQAPGENFQVLQLVLEGYYLPGLPVLNFLAGIQAIEN
jgi:hypothetical protein